MKRFLYFSKKTLPWVIALMAVMVVSTVMIYRSIARLPEERIIIFFYQTNVPASNAAQWAQTLKEENPEIEYAEAQCYTALEGYSSQGMQRGWTYITVRLAKKEGDIFILPKSQFDIMEESNWLLPLDESLFGSFEGAVRNTEGDIMGLEVSSMIFEGLNFPRAEEPYNVLYPLEGDSLIACVYYQTSDPALTKNILNKIISGAARYGEDDYE